MAFPGALVDGLALAAIALEDPALDIAGCALAEPLCEATRARMRALSAAPAGERAASLRSMAAALGPVPRKGVAVATRRATRAPGLDDLLRRIAARGDEPDVAGSELQELREGLWSGEEPSWGG